VPYNRTNPINLQTLIPRLEKALDDKLGANGVVQRIEIVKKKAEPYPSTLLRVYLSKPEYVCRLREQIFVNNGLEIRPDSPE
jgi:hypothetical protein